MIINVSRGDKYNKSDWFIFIITMVINKQNVKQ